VKGSSADRRGVLVGAGRLRFVAATSVAVFEIGVDSIGGPIPATQSLRRAMT